MSFRSKPSLMRLIGAVGLIFCILSCARLSLVPYQNAARLAEIEETAKMVDKLYFSIAADSIGPRSVSEFSQAQARYIEIQAQIEGLKRSYADKKKVDDLRGLCEDAEEVLSKNIEAHRLNDPMKSAGLADILRMQLQGPLNALRRAEAGLPEPENQ